MMTEERTLGPTETRLLNRLAADGRVVFSTAEARAALDGEDRDVNKLLYRLTRKRWLLRLEKGKYLLLPLEAGMEGLYTVHEFVIAAHLVQPYTLAYASAFSFHNLFDLVPETVFVATTRRKAEVVVEKLGLRFRFVTLTPHKFFGIQTVAMEDERVCITTPSKTLVDGLDRPDLCGGIVEVVKGVDRYARGDADWEQVTADADRLGNRTVFKRLGYLVELTGVEAGGWLERWRASISAGETLLDPRYGERGRFDGRWNLRLNVGEEQLLEWRMH
ncbi:MAG: type IV toxin-antitoxin system AbiEi family antitoxin domain-containing protein [Chloroflexota bacterium]